MRNLLPILVFFFLPTYIIAQNVSFTVMAADSAKPISPYIYGTNQLLAGGENWTAMRIGGNRLTGYNWENNASNAGSDWFQSSDDYLTSVFNIPSDSSNIPAIVTEAFYNQAHQIGSYPLVTLQMAGFVAKDKNGTVDSSETAPSSRWAYVAFQKGSHLSLQPDTGDDTVFMDEYVNFLVSKYGTASAPTGIRGYELDNEPDLWNSTHPRLHPLQPTCQEIISRSVNLSRAVKKIDSSAEIFGPVSYGFNGYLSFQGAPDWSTVSAGKGYSWFLDYYLDQMKRASDSTGKRLLDVLDLHWYPEAQGSDGNRIVNSNATTTVDNLARVQAPRTLWDPSYKEQSWIAQYFPSYLPLIPKVMESIGRYYPGTKLAFTEINYGGENDISGALATDDVLGIFAKYGVYLATFWQLNGPSQFISAAYKMYRNYDGEDSKFGDYYIPSRTSDSVDFSIYASIKSDENKIHLIVINKNYNTGVTGSFSILSSKQITGGRVWELNRYGSQIHELDSVTNISNNAFSYPIEAASICHFVLQTSATTNIVERNRTPDKFELAAYPNPFNPSCRIQYNIPDNSISRLEVYSVTGALIKTFDGLSHSGSLTWDGTNENKRKVASGVYFAILRNAEHLFATEKLLLLK
ncbi:MAG TPA: glycoside hydrolase family 44 protein [Candidatus Acidoferrales bacterium]|nr:glycoside hydrolase family 44 protein [Candidatus Acidoferrales bacterium]